MLGNVLFDGKHFVYLPLYQSGMFLGRNAQCCCEVYYLRLLIYYLFVCVYVAPRVHLTKHMAIIIDLIDHTLSMMCVVSGGGVPYIYI